MSLKNDRNNTFANFLHFVPIFAQRPLSYSAAPKPIVDSGGKVRKIECRGVLVLVHALCIVRPPPPSAGASLVK